MINNSLIVKFFECASIQRWNDHVRPVEFTELDKQAHKMIIAYVIAKFEEQRGNCVEWIDLIEGAMFELLQRSVLTDIKSPVFHQMMRDNKANLDTHVIEQLRQECDLDSRRGDSLAANLEQYLRDEEYASREKSILKAAHYLATNWEFKIIYHVSPFVYGIEKTKEMIENQIEDHYNLAGVQEIMLHKKLYGFIDLCGQLRFQTRWAQSPRIPKTSVLGHMLLVSLMGYLCSREIGACRKRLYNNFFSALFHDLPEVLTRDIVSPVKDSVPQLKQWLSGYERRQVEERILPLLPEAWHEEIRYFVIEEFENKIREFGQTRTVGEITPEYNRDENSPRDGAMLKACDKLAAYIEALMSIDHGISSPHLRDAVQNIGQWLEQQPVINRIDFRGLGCYFQERYPGRTT
ncbi:MAG: HD domain-containing protein [Candidatus Omnitrophica bacterium]|nr:HD domain-containing protein [Candidatus Omnitrophota bacterium]